MKNVHKIEKQFYIEQQVYFINIYKKACSSWDRCSNKLIIELHRFHHHIFGIRGFGILE